MLTFIKKYKYIIITAAAIVAALAIAFAAGNTNHVDIQTPDEATTVAQITETTVKPATSQNTTAADTTKESAATTGKPQPVEPQEQTTQDNTLRCTLSISCATILDNMDKLDEEYHELVPSDGWILKPEQFEFAEGESVFDLLVRVCKDKKIHLDHSFTPAYNSAYIKAIGNLYEFDCGDESGWVYGVNGWAPNYGCSRYALKNGDKVEFRYTCQLGHDLKWSE